MATAGKITIKDTVHDEQTFISAVYDYILDLNQYGSAITCIETVADQFTDPSITTPTFNFIITGGIVLRMERAAVKTSSTNSYIFKVLVNDELQAQATVSFAESALAIDAEAPRKLFIGYAIESKNAYIWIGNYNANAFTDSSIAICSISDTTPYNRYGAGNNGPDLEGCSYYMAGQVGVEYTIANLFNYSSTPGYIEYITHISFINTNQEQARNESIVNCSEISQGRSLAIQAGRYFSVGPHTLIKLD